MTLIVTQTIGKSVAYPTLGVWMPSEDTLVDVEYQAVSLISLNNETATVLFNVSIDGCLSSGELTHSFVYSGSGSPLEEAEKSLMNHLKSP